MADDFNKAVSGAATLAVVGAGLGAMFGGGALAAGIAAMGAGPALGSVLEGGMIVTSAAIGAVGGAAIGATSGKSFAERAEQPQASARAR